MKEIKQSRRDLEFGLYRLYSHAVTDGDALFNAVSTSDSPNCSVFILPRITNIGHGTCFIGQNSDESMQSDIWACILYFTFFQIIRCTGYDY